MREEAAILELLTWWENHQDKSVQKLVSQGEGVARSVLPTEDSVSLDTTGNNQHWKEELMEH